MKFEGQGLDVPESGRTDKVNAGPSLSPAPGVWVREARALQHQMLPVWVGAASHKARPRAANLNLPSSLWGRQLSTHYPTLQVRKMSLQGRELRSRGEMRPYCPCSKPQLFPYHEAERSQEGPQVPILLRPGFSFPTNPPPPGHELGGLVPASQSVQDK